MPLPVTAIFAGLLAFWLMYLQFKVVRFRRANDVSLGHGDHEMGERLIRAHGNACETVPIFLILLALAEGMGTPPWVVGGLGVIFLVGRLMHGIHFFRIRDGIQLRFWGMILTLLATGLAALGAIGHGLKGL